MKITAIKPYPVWVGTRNQLIVKVETDEGIHGWGESGLSGLGAVVGATEPEHIARLRELMPRSVFLLPGVGAQGGDPALLGAAFAPGPAGALVSSSRGIAGAPDPAAAAAQLRETLWEISNG